jgi:hypothetical protein
MHEEIGKMGIEQDACWCEEWGADQEVIVVAYDQQSGGGKSVEVGDEPGDGA